MQGGAWREPQANINLQLQRDVFGPYGGNTMEDFGYAIPGLSSRSRSQTPGPPTGTVPLARPVHSRPTSRPPTSARQHEGEVDLGGYGCAADDLQRAKDEKLLELLGEMAKGAAEDDEISSNVLGVLPIEVQEDDPTLRQLLMECGTMWEEVQAEADGKKDLQARLTGELRQIQDRSSRQHQESSALTNRLMSAKQTLAEKLKEAASVHQDLRARITDEWRGNERLRLSMSDGVRNLATLAEDLNKQIVQCGEAQANLVLELEEATDKQAKLQAELQEERVRTWRQSTDVVMAFARGGVAMEGGLDLSAATPAFSGNSAPSRTPPPVSSESKGDEDLKAQLQAERSNLLLAKSSASEELADLERRVKQRAKHISELNKELALEDASRAQLDLQLEDFLVHARSCGVELCTSSQGEQDAILELQDEGIRLDFMNHFREVTELCDELQDKEAECRAAAEEHAVAQEALQGGEAEQEEMDTLRTHLLMAESEQEEQEQHLEEANADVCALVGEVQTEQAALRELDQASGQHRARLRSQLQKHREELAQLADYNQRLINELDAREATGCFRRRQPPPAVRQDFGGGKGQPRRQISPGAPQGRSPQGGKGMGGKKGSPNMGMPPQQQQQQQPRSSKGGKGTYNGRPHDECGGRPPRGKGEGGGVFAEDV